MSANKIKCSKEDFINKLNTRINKGTIIADGIIKQRNLVPGLNSDRRYVDKVKTDYEQWYEITHSVLMDIFESDKYADKFERIIYSKQKLVGSNWQPDIEYYLVYKLIPKLNFLKVLIQNIDDYEEVGLETKNSNRDMSIFIINPNRIKELKEVKNNKFDLKRLIKLCEEMNIAVFNDSTLSIAMLTRAILDHVPPIFNCKNFSEVANNYNGGKSFKELMERLENSSRKIGDRHLHNKIGKSEVLPNITQVNSDKELDVLLSEIIKILKE